MAKSIWHSVILSEAKNIACAKETLRCAQGDTRGLAIVLTIEAGRCLKTLLEFTSPLGPGWAGEG